MTTGQTGVTGSITAATGPESVGNITITSITVVPSCGTLVAAADCADPDPGVYQVTGGTGAAGTACAGTAFTVTTVEAAQGKVRFNPSAPIVLGPPAP